MSGSRIATDRKVFTALLALVARRWALRVPECSFVFHRDGRAIRDFRTTWAAACEALQRRRRARSDRGRRTPQRIPHGSRERRADDRASRRHSRRPARGPVETTRTEHGHFGRFHACSDLSGGHKLLTSLLRRGGGTGRRRRLKIARAHALRGSIPLLGINNSRYLGRSTSLAWAPPCPQTCPQTSGFLDDHETLGAHQRCIVPQGRLKSGGDGLMEKP